MSGKLIIVMKDEREIEIRDLPPNRKVKVAAVAYRPSAYTTLTLSEDGVVYVAGLRVKSQYRRMYYEYAALKYLECLVPLGLVTKEEVEHAKAEAQRRSAEGSRQRAVSSFLLHARELKLPEDKLTELLGSDYRTENQIAEEEINL